MTSGTQSLVLPVLLITVGTGWLLTTLGVAPGIDWIWTLGLAIAGLLILIVGGFNKVTFVTSSFFIAACLLSVARQTGRIALDVEVPVLVILSGVLLMIARSPMIPAPAWVLEPTKSVDT